MTSNALRQFSRPGSYLVLGSTLALGACGPEIASDADEDGGAEAPPLGADEACDWNSDCAAGLTCRDGLCAYPDDDDDDCAGCCSAPGELPLDGLTPRCQPDEDYECSFDSGCPTGYACEHGYCEVIPVPLGPRCEASALPAFTSISVPGYGEIVRLAYRFQRIAALIDRGGSGNNRQFVLFSYDLATGQSRLVEFPLNYTPNQGPVFADLAGTGDVDIIVVDDRVPDWRVLPAAEEAFDRYLLPAAPGLVAANMLESPGDELIFQVDDRLALLDILDVADADGPSTSLADHELTRAYRAVGDIDGDGLEDVLVAAGDGTHVYAPTSGPGRRLELPDVDELLLARDIVTREGGGQLLVRTTPVGYQYHDAELLSAPAIDGPWELVSAPWVPRVTTPYEWASFLRLEDPEREALVVQSGREVLMWNDVDEIDELGELDGCWALVAPSLTGHLSVFTSERRGPGQLDGLVVAEGGVIRVYNP